MPATGWTGVFTPVLRLDAAYDVIPAKCSGRPSQYFPVAIRHDRPWGMVAMIDHEPSLDVRTSNTEPVLARPRQEAVFANRAPVPWSRLGRFPDTCRAGRRPGLFGDRARRVARAVSLGAVRPATSGAFPRQFRGLAQVDRGRKYPP